MDASVSDSGQDLVIAGFWRRIGALLIDGLILGIVGWIIGSVLYSSVASMGASARLIGFVISLAYFGILDSSIGNGQTLAKRWLGIRVVNAQGGLLSVPRAILRNAILSTPFYLNNLPLPGSALMSPLIAGLLALVVFGGLFAIVYLYIFNRRTRQSLHDLAVGSFVVRKQPVEGEAHFASVWQGHLIVVGVFAVLCYAAPFAIKPLVHTNFFAGLIPLYQTLQTQPHVMNAQVDRGAQWMSGHNTTHYIAAQVRVDAPLIDDADYARGIAKILAKGDPHLADEDVVSVVLSYGYDIGIASAWKRRNYSFKPEELQQ